MSISHQRIVSIVSEHRDVIGAASALAVAAFLIFGPFVPAVADTLHMPYVDPPAPILIAGFISYSLLRPRLVAADCEHLARRLYAPLIGGYGLLLTWLAIHKHLSINSHTDLGIFDNVMWNTIHGHLLYSSVLQRNFLGEHAAPILLLLTPFYWLYPSPGTLLALQSFALALAALPICWVAHEQLGSGSALILLAAYFVNRAILGAAFFDFHEIALAVPLLSFALYFCEREMNTALVGALALAVLCKEEVALIVCGFGVYIWLRRGRGALPLGLLAAGILIFIIDFSIVMPFFRGRAAPYIDRYSYLGSTIPMVARTLVEHPLYVAGHVFNPQKLIYMFQLFGSVAFLPIFSIERLIPVAPTLGRILLSGLPPEYSLDFHYSAQLVPFLFFSTVFGVCKLSARAEKNAMWPAQGIRNWFQRVFADMRLPRWFPFRPGFQEGMMVIVLLAAGLLGGNPLRYASRPEALSDASMLSALKQHVPAGARLSADETLVSHFSQRDSILILPELNDTEYVLMDFAGDRYEYPLGREEHRRKLLELTLNGPYRIEWNQGGVVLLRKDPNAKQREADGKLDTLLFDFPRDSLQSVRARRGAGRTTFTIPHLFPPGSYNLTFRIETSSKVRSALTSAKFAATRFENADDEEIESPQILAEKTIFMEREAPGRYSVHLSFANPTWDLLQFHVWYRSRSDLSVESIQVRPSDGGATVLQALRDY